MKISAMKILPVLLLLLMLSACGRSTPYEPAHGSAASYANDGTQPYNENTPPSSESTPSTSEATQEPEPSPSTTDATPEPIPYSTTTPKPPPIRLMPYEPDYIPLIPRWEEGEPFLTEHFLCDFEYLMHTLRHNFPLFGPAYRRLGIDIDAIEAMTRDAITTNNVLTPNRFSSVLRMFFFDQFGGFGHLYQHWESRIHLVLANIYRYSMDEDGSIINAYSQRIYDIMRAPAAIRFYGNITVDLGEYESGRVDRNNISTNILVPGEVAYINVRRFNHYNIDHDREIIFAFYEEIAGFNHLIIDLQENLGGFPHYFYQLFVEPNITTGLEWRELEFFPAGGNNLIFADALIGDIVTNDPGSATLYYNGPDFIAENDMKYFNPDDMNMLHNLVAWHHRIDPIATEKAFDGKIWVLVGPMTQSAAEAIAIFIRETGFATLVGQPTAGIMGAISAYLLLPNSGIIVRYDLGYMTDSYGRSFEELGVMPHYFSHPGMSALETALEIIGD